MKKLMVLAGLGLAGLGMAQTNPMLTPPSGIGIRLGYVLPIDNAMRDLAKSYLGVGIDFDQSFKVLDNAETTISADWIAKSGSGAHGNIFPIMLNQRFWDNTHTSYFFIGAGVAIMDITSTSTVLAGRLGYGMTLGPKVYAEGTLLYTDGADGVHGTSGAVYLGYKF
jgi:hypothetical protein